MATIAEAVEQQREIINNIKAIRGENYAKVVHHAAAQAMFTKLMPTELAMMHAVIGAAILSDLSRAYGIDLDTPEGQSCFTKDLEALTGPVGK